MYALAAAQSQQSGSSFGIILLLLPLLLLAAMFWSSRKRQKHYQEAQASLAPGEQVITTSGLYGRITTLDDKAAQVEVAPGVVLTIDRRALMPNPDAGPVADTTNEENA